MESKTANNQIFDIAKLFFAYSVVGIHTIVFRDINYDLWYYIQHLVFIMAVPFFFMCSGYFYNPQKDTSLLPKSVKRLMVPYFIWSIIYTIVARDFDVQSIIKGYLIASPGASMWFVGALMISMVILKFIKNKNALRLAICVSLIFYFIGLFLNSYSELIRGTTLEPYALKYIEIFESTRNFVFIGFPMTSIGYYIGRYGIPKFFQKRGICIGLFSFALVIQLVEILYLKDKPNTFSGGWSYYFSLPLLVSSLLCLLLQLNLKFNINTVYLRKLSTGIYFSHLVIIVCVSTLSGVLWHFNVIENNFNTVLMFILVSIISTVFTMVVIKLNNKWLNKLF